MEHESGEVGDFWAGTIGSREYEVNPPIKGGKPSRYRLMVVDEESKLDLNGMNQNWLPVFANLLQILGVEEDEAKHLAYAVWDWKDADDSPRGPEGENEIRYYTEYVRELTGRSPGAEGSLDWVFPKNARFDTVEELLQIPDMPLTDGAAADNGGFCYIISRFQLNLGLTFYTPF